MKHKERWYQKRLNERFIQKYAQYEKTVEWFVNPAPNVWKFDIPELKVRIVMTCDDKGNITESLIKLRFRGGMKNEGLDK